MLSSLLTIWKDLCALFSWNNSKLLILGALNTYVRSLVLIVQNFWWLLIMIVMAKLADLAIVQDFLILLISFIYLLVVRPAIERKDFDYYIKYLKRFPLYLFLALTIISIVFIPYKIAAVLLHFPFNYPGSLVQGPFSIICITGLFFLDGNGSLRSVFWALANTVKFILYTLPLISVIFLFESFAVYYTVDVPLMMLAMPAHGSVKMNLLRLGLFMVHHVLTVLLFSLLATLYIRVKHSHHKLFFS